MCTVNFIYGEACLAHNILQSVYLPALFFVIHFIKLQLYQSVSFYLCFFLRLAFFPSLCRFQSLCLFMSVRGKLSPPCQGSRSPWFSSMSVSPRVTTQRSQPPPPLTLVRPSRPLPPSVNPIPPHPLRRRLQQRVTHPKLC